MKKVSPIKSIDEINKMKKYLWSNKRDYLFFVIGINSGIRGCDILQLKIKDIKYVSLNDEIQIKEKKTKKINHIVINKTIYKAIQEYINEYPEKKNDDYIFTSKKGKGDKPINVYSMSRMVKQWCYDMNMKGNYGLHSLRKTFGYIQRVKYGVGFDVLCRKYNHSSPKTTMVYLGISSQETKDICMNEI